MSFGVIASISAASLLVAPTAHAQTWNWVGPNWTTPGSWNPSTVPVSSATTILTFRQPQTAAEAPTAPGNLGTFELNGMVFSSRTGGFGWGLSSISPIFQFRGINAFINTEGNGGTSLFANVQIGADFTFGGPGTGTFGLSGTLQNASGSTPGTINVSMDPRAVLDLNTTSAFAGTWVLNSGLLRLNNASGLGNVQTNLIYNGGRMFIAMGGGTSFTAPVTLNQTLSLGGTAKFTGALSGAGGFISDSSYSTLNVFQGTPPSLEFTAASTFAGPVTIGSGNKVLLSGSQGAFSGATAYSLGFDGVLTLDNTGVPSGSPINRVRDDAAILLQRADLALNGGTASISERVGAITLRGMGQLSVSGSSGTRLTAASLVRENHSTVHFIAGSGTSLRFDASLASDLIGAGGAAGSTRQSILPYAFARTSTGSESLATVDALGTVRSLSSSEFNSGLYSIASGESTQENVRLNNSGLIDRPTSINALVLGTENDSTLPSGLFGSTPLRIGSGAIVTGSGGFLNLFAAPALISTSVLDFAAREAVVHSGRNLTILSPVSGSGGLTKSAAATLVLGNSASTFSGQVSIHAGTLAVASDSALGNAANPVLLASGGNGGLSFQANPEYGAMFDQLFTTSRSFNLFGSGGSLGTPAAGATLDVPGPIAGSGSLFIQGNGVTRLLGANSYTGDTVVAGQLAISSSAALGTSGDLTLLTSSTLRTLGSFTLNRPVHLPLDRDNSSSPPGMASIVIRAGDVLTAAAPIGDYGVLPAVGVTSGLQLPGGGTLVATADNRFRGIVMLGSPRPRFNTDSSVPADFGGGLTLSGPDGAFSAASVIANTNATLLLDNTAVNRNSRIGGSVILEGGNLVVRGNNAASTTERFGIGIGGSGTGPANRFSTITLAPGASQSIILRSTNLPLGDSMIGGLLIRGEGLGIGAGLANSSSIIADTIPNGAGGNATLPGVIADSSSTGLGTTFARLDPTRGVVPLSNSDFVATPTANANIDLHSAALLSQDLVATSLRLGSGAALNTQGHQLALSAGLVLSNGDPSGTDLTGGGTLRLGTSPVIHTSTPLRLNNVNLSSDGQIVKSGPSDLTLSLANSTIGGPIVVAGGTLRLTDSLAPGTPRRFILQPSVFGAPRLDLAGSSIATSFLTGDGVLDLGAGGSLTGSVDFRGTIVGSGPVGGSALELNFDSWLYKSSPFTGQVWIRGGSLTLASDQPTSGPGPIGSGSEPLLIGNTSSPAVVSNLVLAPGVRFFDRDIHVLPGLAGNPMWINGGSAALHGRITLDSITRLSGDFYGEITGAGSVRTEFPFTQLWHANTYSGGTVLGQPSILGIGNDSALGTGPVTLTASTTIRAVGGPRAIANPVNLTAGVTLIVSGVDALRMSGPINLGTTTSGFQINSTAPITISGSISAPTNAGLTKFGPGTLVLSGANTYTGATTIASGMLLANNTAGSASGTGSVLVSSGAMLGGAGSISGPVTLAAGAIIAPGAATGFTPGTLSIGALSSVATSLFAFDLGSPLDPAASDLLILANAAPITSLAGTLDIHPGPAFGWGSYTLLTYNGPLIPAVGRQWSLPASIAGFNTQLDYLSRPGQVLLVVVPAPGSTVLVACAAGLLALRRRRRL